MLLNLHEALRQINEAEFLGGGRVRQRKTWSSSDQTDRETVPLVRDCVAWFEQQGVKFGQSAYRPRRRRAVYVLNVHRSGALIAPISTKPTPNPDDSFPLPVGSIEGMRWFDSPDLQRYLFPMRETVSEQYFMGRLEGSAAPPTSDKIRQYLGMADASQS